MITRTRVDDEKGGFKEVLTEEQSSAECSRNAKGEFVWTMKVYKDDPKQLEETGKDFLAAIAAIRDEARNLQLVA